MIFSFHGFLQPALLKYYVHFHIEKMQIVNLENVHYTLSWRFIKCPKRYNATYKWYTLHVKE